MLRDGSEPKQVGVCFQKGDKKMLKSLQGWMYELGYTWVAEEYMFKGMLDKGAAQEHIAQLQSQGLIRKCN